MKFFAVLAATILLAGSAAAQANPDFTIFDAQIAALQQRIDADAMGGSLKPEALQDLQGKQQELVNREAKLKQGGSPTADEKSALALSISDQQKRLAALTRTAGPRMNPVDPALLPAPTYMTPNGATISGQNPMPGVPNSGDVVPLPVPAPNNP